LHKGAGSAAHFEATSFVEICAEDMRRLNITEGQTVRLCSDAGHVDVQVRIGDLPSGLIFIPMGPTANQLVDTETFGTGMPSFKGESVRVEPL
jgi:formylmethanofuran dehydrogenase subunit D